MSIKKKLIIFVALAVIAFGAIPVIADVTRESAFESTIEKISEVQEYTNTEGEKYIKLEDIVRLVPDYSYKYDDKEQQVNILKKKKTILRLDLDKEKKQRYAELILKPALIDGQVVFLCDREDLLKVLNKYIAFNIMGKRSSKERVSEDNRLITEKSVDEDKGKITIVGNKEKETDLKAVEKVLNPQSYFNAIMKAEAENNAANVESYIEPDYSIKYLKGSYGSIVLANIDEYGDDIEEYSIKILSAEYPFAVMRRPDEGGNTEPNGMPYVTVYLKDIKDLNVPVVFKLRGGYLGPKGDVKFNEGEVVSIIVNLMRKGKTVNTQVVNVGVKKGTD